MMQITIQKNKSIILLLGGLAGALVSFFLTVYVYANPIIFAPSAKTTTATTTMTALTPGTGTTTLVFDSYQNIQGSNVSRNTFGTKDAALLVQFNGSSTNSRLRIDFEYSQDGVDWYLDELSLDNFVGTTTQQIALDSSYRYLVPYASSTLIGGMPQGVTISTSSSTPRAIKVKTPTRYVRAVFTAPPWPLFPYQPTTTPSFNGMVWAEFVPIRETN